MKTVVSYKLSIKFSVSLLSIQQAKGNEQILANRQREVAEHYQTGYSQNPVETTGIAQLRQQTEDNMIKSGLRNIEQKLTKEAFWRHTTGALSLESRVEQNVPLSKAYKSKINSSRYITTPSRNEQRNTAEILILEFLIENLGQSRTFSLWISFCLLFSTINSFILWDKEQ